MSVKTVELRINIVHSKDGGSISYDRDTTIKRIADYVDEMVRKRVPIDHQCSLVMAVGRGG